jgi:uncharacterized protein with HEPN domain
MRDDRERLQEIQEAIARIERYASRGRNAFDNDELIQTWVLHHLPIIGEACRALTSHLRGLYPAVPWSKIIGMRNILVHNYFEIDVRVVWSVIERDLPVLKAELGVILQDLDASP